MKEFEKRWNFRYRNDSKHQSFEHEVGKYFWKAALKWALKTAKELDEQDAPISMNDVIKAELEQ